MLTNGPSGSLKLRSFDILVEPKVVVSRGFRIVGATS